MQWGGGGSGSGVLIQAMCVYNNELYLTGYFTNVDGNFCNGFAKWDGLTWSVPMPYSFMHGNDLQVYHNKLYIAGTLSFPPGCGFASYDGNNFQAFNGLNIGRIYTMDTFNNYLYVGGGFEYLEGVYCNKIARFNDDSVVCFPPILEQSGDTLFVNETGYFHWINCADNSLIAGATANFFIPDSVGNYAVIVTSDGCNDTTACIYYNGVNELLIEDYRLQIYPNPANETVTIEYKATTTGKATITIENYLGQTIQTLQITTNEKQTLDISNYPSGMYFIKCFDGKEMRVVKLVKQ